MTQEINIGLFESQPGWKRILEQEKVPWTLFDLDEPLEKYSVIIVNSKLSSEKEIAYLKDYLENSGSVLTSAENLRLIDKKQEISRIFIKKITGSGPLFRNTNEVHIESYGYKIKNANHGTINNRHRAVLELKYKKGTIIALPFNLNSLLLDKRSKKQFFSSPHRPVKELVSLVSKGNIRRIIVNALHHLHSIRNLPYVHTWYYPRNYNTAFSFRVDVDKFLDEGINYVLGFLKKEKIRITWFISAIDGKNHMNGIKRLYDAKQDIQSHAYEHLIYKSLEENYSNIRKSNEILGRIKKPIKGFCAPFGHWNKNLDLALEKLNYDYSSDYSLDYDNFPFYPFIENRDSRILQIPIYPTCIALMHMRLYSREMMKDYLSYLIQMQYKKQMPLFLYDHPNDGIAEYPEIFFHTIKEIKKLHNTWLTTLTEFSCWWKKRESTNFKAEIKDNNINITTKNKDKDIYIRIITKGHKEMRLPLIREKIDLNKITAEDIPEFMEKKIKKSAILKSQLSFKIFYTKILARAILRRLI